MSVNRPSNVRLATFFKAVALVRLQPDGRASVVYHWLPKVLYKYIHPQTSLYQQTLTAVNIYLTAGRKIKVAFLS